ncbi:bromodomain adjacent to zinc finger domain protein 1A isoform X2 [Corvus moneduloides]|uniref:bromodomain adjacent to zinc finger domain protein 1A isoform X2 n=1 Tax=Corvus moneduloides TaxID=1196302 RepID=UPI00136337F6|nr:bromodomain adjacent to zinc finger domain protein 1A isoform X2 [Corvus moneduloides]
MPLLHRKPFVRVKPPADLRPDERVFYCRVTNEIFRNYDDFFERTILCNSLVWSCAVTGKPGLTYQEALESEKKARHNLQSFPEALIIPVLYLATLTHRTRLHEICDEIFAYVKDRYFVDETVEVLRNNGARLQCKVLEVIAPTHHNGMANGHTSSADGDTIVISDSDDSETHNSSAQNGEKKAIIDPSLFKYKVQPIKKHLYEPVVVKASQLSRRKHLFSRDRLKLFLKQHCEPHDGVIKAKSTSIEKYNLAERNFSYFFPDEPPTFVFSPASRRRGRPPKRASASLEDNITAKNTPGNKSKVSRERARFQKQKDDVQAIAFEKAKLKQEKANAIEARKKEKEDKEKKREELKKIVEEERMKKKEEKERLKIEKEKEREKLREEKRKYVEYLKQWSKPREDMECDDLKELPIPMPVKTRLPPEIFGDALMVLEFLHAFGELFDLQDEFPEGVTLEVLEEALVGNDTEGPLCELLFFFLTAIFQAMAEEEEEVAKEQIADAETKGCNLKNLDLDSCTLSEILRLHILASGADITSANAKYRYQKRGGFDTTDDACMELRLSNPGLLKKLSSTSVYDLLPGEKMKILHALCGKLLTLVSTRDFIEDSVDVLRQAKQEFRELKAEQHRKEREAAAARIRKKREERLKEQELKMKEKQEKLKEEEQRIPAVEISVGEEEREDLDTSTESKEMERKEQDMDTVTEDEEELGPNKRRRRGRRGQNGYKEFTRQEETTCEKSEPLTAEDEEALKQEQQKKEKELLEKIQNATACTNITPLGRDRLYRRYWIFPSVPGLFVEEDYSGLTEDMLLPRTSSFQNSGQSCTNEPQVFSKTGESLKSSESTSNIDQDSHTSVVVEVPRPVYKPNRWCFYSSREQLDQLLEALNSRGHRESALKETLLQEKSRIYEQLSSFPVEKFHIPEKPQSDIRPPIGRGRMQNIHDGSHLPAEKQLELRLRDFLLDIEDRIYQGTLGAIKVTDRQAWRAALEHGRYEFLNDENKENGIIKTVNEEPEEMETDDQDKFIVKDRLVGLKTEAPSAASTSTSTPQPVSNVVHYLASALLQIEQGIERRFLKAPLDASDGGRSYKTVLDRWRESLLSSTSLSQVFLHLSTLDRSVIWSKSILNARCKVCRKKGDAESMVLCDGCDRGYHTYCIRPKLKVIPEGDWFCPECRPKQRSRRLSSRQRPSVESDEETAEQLEGEEEADYDEMGQSEEEHYEEEQDEEDESQEEEEISPSKQGRSQVKFPLKMRAAKLNNPFSSQNSQRQARYASRSQQIESSSKITRRGLRNIKSASSAVTKPTLKLNSRTTRQSQSSLQADVFVELLGPRRRRRGRKSADNTLENSPSNSLGFRIVDTADSSERLRKFPVSASKLSLPVAEPKRRGRKRQSTESPPILNRRSSGRQGGVHELSAFEQLIVELVRHDDSWPFMKLVSKIQVPDYYDIIKKPIALNIIREKVNKCEYKLASEFIEDIELMFSNCFEYNPRNTSEAKAGTRLQAFFHIQAQKLGLPITSGNVDHTAPVAKKSRI